MRLIYSILAIICVILAIIGEQNGVNIDTILLFVDLPSITFVLLSTLFFGLVQNSFKTIYMAHHVALTGQKVSNKDAHMCIEILSSLRALYLITGGAGFIIGLVKMLANLSDPTEIGPALAVAFLPVLYGLILAELWTHSLMYLIKVNQSISHNSKQTSQALPAEEQ